MKLSEKRIHLLVAGTSPTFIEHALTWCGRQVGPLGALTTIHTKEVTCKSCIKACSALLEKEDN